MNAKEGTNVFYTDLFFDLLGV